MTKHLKFIGTKFADTLGLSDTALNEKLKGRAGDDTLLGGLGNDKIKAGDGNDWIVGGAGNDDIDGGKGYDVAVYQGQFSDYILSFKSDHVGTIRDQVAGRDGTDTLKKVEFLKFSDGIYDIGNDSFEFFNHAPDVTGPVTGLAVEDGPGSALDALAHASDVDADALAVVNVPVLLPDGVSYNAATHTFTLNPANAAYQHLALAQPVTVTVNYGVSDGLAVTPASVSWTVSGVNDAPAVSGAVTSASVEDGASSTLDALANASDVDDGATLQATNVAAVLPAGVTYNAAAHTFTLDPTNAAYQYLALNQPTTVTVNYGVTDGLATTPASVAWTLTGANDAPTLQDIVGSEPVFGEDSLTLSGVMAFADIDLADMHIVGVEALGNGYIGSVTAGVDTDSNGTGAGMVGLSYHLTRAQFDAAGGQFQDHQDYRITIDDLHGGTAERIVSIPLADILNQGGGTQEPPVFINTSPPNPFVTGGNLGQVTDNPFLLSPVGPWSILHVQGTLQFTDADGGNHHASVDLAHASIVGHFLADSNGVPQPVTGAPTVTTLTGTWQVFAQEPGQVLWSYDLSESAIRAMSQGEWQTMLFPITVYEDGVGQSTQNVRIDLFGTTEVPSLLPPNTMLTASTDISPYLLPPDLATHMQVQNFSITEDPLVTGSTHQHMLSGTISFVDPDRLDLPTVTMELTDPGVPLNAAIQSVRDGFHYTVEQFGNYGMIHWTYEGQDGELDFMPQDGTLTVGARFNVGELAGGSSSVVNVTLHGSNDAVAIPGPQTTQASVALAGGASGSFIFSDPDWYPDGHSVDFVWHNPDTHGFVFGGTNVETGTGEGGTVVWNYFADFGVGTLVPGQHDGFDIVLRDHYGATTTHTVDILLI